MQEVQVSKPFPFDEKIQLILMFKKFTFILIIVLQLQLRCIYFYHRGYHICDLLLICFQLRVIVSWNAMILGLFNAVLVGEICNRCNLLTEDHLLGLVTLKETPSTYMKSGEESLMMDRLSMCIRLIWDFKWIFMLEISLLRLYCKCFMMKYGESI